MRKGALAVAAWATLLASTLLASMATPASAFTGPNNIRVTASVNAAFVDSYFTFSWDIRLNSSTPPGAITDTALYYDTVPHGPVGFEYWQYASRASASTGDGISFITSVRAPPSPTRLYVIMIANVSGATIYNTTEWVVDVQPTPKLTLVTSGYFTPGEAAAVQLKVEWNGTSPLQLVTVHNDMVSHAANINSTFYPNSTPPQAGSGRSFNFTVTAPPLEGTLYLIGRVRAGGRDFYTDRETAVPITSGPHVSEVVFAPAAVALTGQPVTVTFKLAFSGGSITGFFRYDAVSHVAEGGNASLYPRASTSMTAAGGNFTVTFNAPSEAGTIYGVVALLSGGRSYTGSQELSLALLARPTIAIVGPPAQLDLGKVVRLSWKITFSGSDSLIKSSDLLWSSTSIGQTPTAAAHVETGVFDAASGTWSASVPAQDGEGILHIAVRATVNGMVVYMSPEQTFTVAKAKGGFLPGPEAFLAGAALLAAAVVARNAAVRSRRDGQ